MSSYQTLAHYYEAVNEQADYPRWAEYLAGFLRRARRPVHTVLDLACGTGAVSRELSRMGYEMIGVDLSPEMLAVAEECSRGLENKPLYLCQAMEDLDLYGTVDAAVCCMDSINYILDKRLLLRALRRVSLFLEPGGPFVFDAVTPRRLENLNGQSFVSQVPGAVVAWQGAYDRRRRLAEFTIDVFEEAEGGLYRRATEEHFQRAWTPEELTELLHRAGFPKVRRFGELRRRGPRPEEERVFFAAENNWKEKKRYE